VTLEERVAELEALVEAQRELIGRQAATIEGLTRRVADLEAELAKNSSNSSLPPSSDTAAERQSRQARRRSQREASKRRPGKQPGEPGTALRQVDHPGVVVVHPPGPCARCGGDLARAEVTGVARRQVFDLPEPRLEVTEHVSESRRCACGHVTVGAFPPEAEGPACWGPRARALCVYLLVYQHVPVARAAELLAALGVPVSTGWVAGQSPRAAHKLGRWLAELRLRLAGEPVLHADETSGRVAGTLWWLHVVSTSALTLLVAHRRRGKTAVEDIGVLGARAEGSTLVHDRAAMYWDYGAGHALCAAHLLRDLAGAATVEGQARWAKAMTELLLDAKAHADTARAEGRPALDPATLADIDRHYHAIVSDALAAAVDLGDDGLNQAQRHAQNLAGAFFDYEPEILAFTRNLRIPFDNNQAERDLRMTKIHQRISGGWRTPHGIQTFAQVRSYLESGRKNTRNALDLLYQLFTTGPWPLPTG
jgi:transposase